MLNAEIEIELNKLIQNINILVSENKIDKSKKNIVFVKENENSKIIGEHKAYLNVIYQNRKCVFYFTKEKNNYISENFVSIEQFLYNKEKQINEIDYNGNLEKIFCETQISVNKNTLHVLNLFTIAENEKWKRYFIDPLNEKSPFNNDAVLLKNMDFNPCYVKNIDFIRNLNKFISKKAQTSVPSPI